MTLSSKLYNFFALALYLISFVQNTTSENILVVFQLPAETHFKSFQPLFEELIDRGHNMTIISAFNLSENYYEKYKHIDVTYVRQKLEVKFAEIRKMNRLENLIFSNGVIMRYNEHVLKDPQIQRLLKSGIQFDAVFIELLHLDISLAFGYYFNAPIIGLSPQKMSSFYSWSTGNPMTPSFCPNLYLPFSNEMSFFERFVNSIYGTISNFYYELVSLDEAQKLMNQYFFKGKKQIPEIKKLMQNISLILENSHYSIGYAEPHLPNYVQVAGLHIAEPEPLPDNINKFMNEASHGVIYISFGGFIDPKDVEHLGETFLNALSKLPQKIILKWDSESLSYVPQNFLVLDWIPQTSVLTHPNCKLFITQGGFHSLLEAVKFSVPLIGIPFYTDQEHNVAMIEHLKIGKHLGLDFTKSELLDTVRELLENPIYRENIQERSQLFNDRLASPLKAAIYWVEYVMRYKDLNHLKPASLELEWYQYLLIDVLMVFVILTTLTTILVYIFFKLFTGFLTRIKHFLANTFGSSNIKALRFKKKLKTT